MSCSMAQQAHTYVVAQTACGNTYQPVSIVDSSSMKRLATFGVIERVQGTLQHKRRAPPQVRHQVAERPRLGQVEDAPAQARSHHASVHLGSRGYWLVSMSAACFSGCETRAAALTPHGGRLTLQAAAWYEAKVALF